MELTVDTMYWRLDDEGRKVYRKVPDDGETPEQREAARAEWRSRWPECVTAQPMLREGSTETA